VAPGEESDQKLAELILIITSLLLISAIKSSNLFMKMTSVVAFAIYVFFVHNVALYHSIYDISIIVKEMIVVCYAGVANI
jgi:hypothetical protein